jgi:hypothetical protein
MVSQPVLVLTPIFILFSGYKKELWRYTGGKEKEIKKDTTNIYF